MDRKIKNHETIYNTTKDKDKKNFSRGYLLAGTLLHDEDELFSINTKKENVNKQFMNCELRKKGKLNKQEQQINKGFLAFVNDYKESQHKKGLSIYGKKLKKY